MRHTKFDLPKEQFNCMRLLGSLYSEKNPPELTDIQKQMLANFFVGCIANQEFNKLVFSNKGKLRGMGIHATVINLILDFTFCTRHADLFDNALAVFTGKERLNDSIEVVRQFAYVHNFHALHATLLELQKHGVLCDTENKLSGLLGKCKTAQKTVEGLETMAAKTPGFTPGLYGQPSAHNEILTLFRWVKQNFTLNARFDNGKAP